LGPSTLDFAESFLRSKNIGNGLKLSAKRTEI
jgi:hypothetical protein